jgi:hypothetical protein
MCLASEARPAMTEPMSAADILAELERMDRDRERIDGDRAGLMERLRVVLADAPQVAPAPADPFELPRDLIEIGAAAALARRAKSTVAAWCRRHPFDGQAGFAVKLGSRWLLSKSLLLKHLGIPRAI